MQPAEIIKFIENRYKKSYFTQSCGIQIIDINCGKASVGLDLKLTEHTNLHGTMHGGLVMTLIDNATGIAGASIGKSVVTLSATIDFIKGAKPGEFVVATAEIRSMEDSIINMVTNLYSRDTSTIFATGMSCMFIVDKFSDIPEKW